MRINEGNKYVVRDWATHRAVTQGANRANSHAVRRHLGDRFYVFNRITRKESR